MKAKWYQDDHESGSLQPSRRGFFVIMGCLGLTVYGLVGYAVVAAKN